MVMRGPRVSVDHPDRLSLCEEALEVRFFELMEERQLMVLLDEALAVGWNKDEVRDGVRNLLVAKALSDADIDLKTRTFFEI
jgi:hypothetical protein